MTRKIEIEPITRIEGHGKVTLHLGDDGRVSEARFNVVEFRGLEKVCEGRLFWEMPLFICRACGICPVSHHLAAAKAGDAILGVQIPPTAKKLRELMHMAQYLQSHALHFFHLASPEPAARLRCRSGKAKRRWPDRREARAGGQRRYAAQVRAKQIIEMLGEKRVHPPSPYPVE